MAIVLIITTGSGENIEAPIFSQFILGRFTGCDLVLDDVQVSGKHGFFELGPDGKLIYTDLGSTNGTLLNGKKINKAEFKIGDVIKIGQASIIIDEKKLDKIERIVIGRTFLSGPKKEKEKEVELEQSTGNTKLLTLDQIDWKIKK